MIIQASEFSASLTSKCPYHLSPFRNFLNFWLNRKRPSFRLATCVISNFVLRRCPLHPAEQPRHSAYPMVTFLVWWVPHTTWISILFLFLQGSFVFVASQVSCIHFNGCLALFYPHIHHFLTPLGLILVLLLFLLTLRCLRSNSQQNCFAYGRVTWQNSSAFVSVLLKPLCLGRVFCKGVSVLVVFPMGLFCFG